MYLYLSYEYQKLKLEVSKEKNELIELNKSLAKNFKLHFALIVVYGIVLVLTTIIIQLIIK